TPPSEVARARLAPGLDSRLLSMAGDPASGVVGVAFERRDDNGTATGIDVALSADAGRTWLRAPAVDGEAYLPAIAIGNGSIFVAYVGPAGYAVTPAVVPPRTRGDSTVSIDPKLLAWSSQPLPKIDGFTPTDAAPAIAVNGAGKPAVASMLSVPNGSRR